MVASVLTNRLPMADRPILYSSAMVRAQLERRKTQTRRLPTRLIGFGKITEFGPSDTKGYDWHFRDKGMRWHDLKHDELLKVLPWQVGDRLFVRETWRFDPGGSVRDAAGGTIDEIDPEVFYRADCSGHSSVYRWEPAIHMPRWASRLTNIVTDVRVQRLYDISHSDAIAEGLQWVAPTWGIEGIADSWQDDPRMAYRALWDSINGRGAADKNPWVVAVTYTVDQRNIDQVTA